MEQIEQQRAYQNYNLPSWAPPSWVFGPVWSILYSVIAVSFGFIFYAVIKGVLPREFAIPFVLNLILNVSYTYIAFGLRDQVLAAVDVALLWGTILWIIRITLNHPLPAVRLVAYAQVPYLTWVTYAMFLQTYVAANN
jgi:translocator protein